MVGQTPHGTGFCNGRSPGAPVPGRAGFTIVEVIVAIVILAVGLLGMAGTTTVVLRQVTMANLATARTVALQSTLERLRGIPFDNVAAGTDSVGLFQVTWTVTDLFQWKDVEIVTTGPGQGQASGYGMVSPNVADTFTHRIIRP
jgi:prepilin-type N-terminal cleavage/methylation domain-containing protein